MEALHAVLEAQGWGP